jgi:hypothetical protein
MKMETMILGTEPYSGVVWQHYRHAWRWPWLLQPVQLAQLVKLVQQSVELVQQPVKLVVVQVELKQSVARS